MVQEMIRYLEHIKRSCDLIVKCENTILPYSVIDDLTVERLEGLCPRYSICDREHVVALMRGRVLFPSVVDEISGEPCLRIS